MKKTNLCVSLKYMLCQKTDSGSNNNTMAKTMHNQLKDLGGMANFEWDYHTMHIKCFCHKMPLVVNAGLKALGLEAPPPPKIKQYFLGTFPYPNQLEVILEEDEGEGEETEGEVIVIDGTAANGDGDDNDDENDDDNEDKKKGMESEDEEDEEDKERKQQDPEDSDDEEVTQSKSKIKNATN